MSDPTYLQETGRAVGQILMFNVGATCKLDPETLAWLGERLCDASCLACWFARPRAWPGFVCGTSRSVDVAVYPEGYGLPGYSGAKVEPVWQEVVDLTMIERFGFSAADFF